MPRVRASAGQPSTAYASPSKSVQIPLNDDRQEKAARLQSRHALQSKQLDQLKAAASPARKRKSMGGEGPNTPSQEDGYGVRGDAVTPMKRMPLLANFEEWMKMATDNKINANNSWNFALIDYFHDMSLLREGDSVNFQKASCTLDGCVKIYTSRVDSVATETGKLLSGLADSGNKKRKGGDDAEEGAEDGEEDDEEGQDGTKKKNKKRTARSAEATLVNSFEQLRLKKMELEFSVDPLFKKASADFDEGGAKGLLLNHLSIDGTGRIVFDSSDDAQEVTDETRRDSMDPEGEEEEQEKEPETAVEDGPVDIAGLGARFFPDLARLDEQDICPSLKTFELGSGDNAMDLPFLKAPENWRDEHPEVQTQAGADEVDSYDAPAPYDDDDNDAGGAAFDIDAEVGFGEGGEAWAKDAALQPQMRVHDALEDGDEGGEVGTFDANSNAYGVTLQHREQNDQENILNYFDNALHKNWAGPEHWKIARIKEANKPAAPQRVRKEKEPFEIDFAAPMSGELARMLYTKASSNAAISLPKREWRSKTRNLLPDDKHFNSKDLLKLFLKPKAKLGARRGGQKSVQREEPEVDEAYWANQQGPAPEAEPLPTGDYDANFFADDNLPMPGEMDDGDSFADAQENLNPAFDDAADLAGLTGPGIDAVAGSADATQEGAFGAQLVTQSRRLRPEYVQYARVAKKVDVRRLKENMWNGIGFEERYVPTVPLVLLLSLTTYPPRTLPPQTPSSRPQIPALAKDETSTLKFTDIMNNLSNVYPQKALADISTSFGFICLLHLANEKGLTIENVEGWEDLSVRRDLGAVVGEGDV